jgi:membrane-bound ClpP family serine protease
MTLNLFGKQNKTLTLTSDPLFILDLNQLKMNEVIELRCDPNSGVTNIRKLEGLPGKCFATAKDSFKPGGTGQVIWKGSSWSARCFGEQKIMAGQTVLIQAIEGLTLYATPLVDPTQSLNKMMPSTFE